MTQPDKDLSARLLPCPLCGGGGRLALGEHDFEGAEVMCVECGCQSGHYGNDPLGAAAIAHWNHRADLDAAVLAEREAIAVFIETHAYTSGGSGRYMAQNKTVLEDTHHATIAAAIRARGVTE